VTLIISYKRIDDNSRRILRKAELAKITGGRNRKNKKSLGMIAL
jgi:hypothetical protein